MALALARSEAPAPQAELHPDRRRHRRVPVNTRVRGMTRSGEEFEAVSIDICAGGLRLGLGKHLPVGEGLVLYLDQIGRVEGTVVRPVEFGYAIRFHASPRKQDKISDQLTWLLNRERLGLSDDRVAERRTSAGQVVVSYGKGMSIACAVLDASVFGLALKTNGPRPLVGDRVTVGDRKGVCVRYIDGGFAIDFRQATTD